MHSLTLNVNDGFYNQQLSFLNQNQVNIVEDISDNYPSISKNKADQRVTRAVEKYRNGTIKTVPYSQGMDEINSWLNSL